MILFAAILAAACGRIENEEAESGSSLHYITFGPSVSGLVSKVKSRTITACLSGHSSADRAKWEENIRSSILKWVDALRGMSKQPLTSDVQVVDGRGNCDVNVTIAPNTHANTSVSRIPTVRMSPTGYFSTYNVLLHEFGHAFALSDTYQNGQSGNCKPGQPQAVMCNTRFSELQTDDVAGVQAVFKRVFPGESPGVGPDTGGSVVDPQTLTLELAVAIGKPSGVANSEVFVGVSGTDAKSNLSLQYCLKNCGVEASWARMAYSREKSGTFIFAAGSQALNDRQRMEFRAVSGARKKTAAIEFRAR